MRFSSLIVMLPALMIAGPSCGQDTAPIVFKFANDEVAQGGTKVFRGVEADPNHFRNIIVTDFDLLKKSDDYCTGALVGPEAVLTAAHCMVNAAGELRPAVMQIDGRNWTLTCMRSEKQKTDRSFDYVLCRLKKPNDASPLPSDLFFDSVDTRPVNVGEPVLLVGYGCETMSLDADRNIVPGPKARSFRIGDETIAKAPAGSPAISIYSLTNEPALCPGDSGGPLMTGITTKTQEAERSIRGINYNVSGGREEVKYRSTVVALSHPVFVDLLKAWRAANPGALVCEIVNDPAKDHKGRCL